MNYWHIQLHPDDKQGFNEEVIKDILKTKKVIGLGDAWEDKNGNPAGAPDYFKNSMQIGDIVMVRSTITPVGLVEVVGKDFIEKNPDSAFDWFPLRRKIKLLDFFGSSKQELLDSILKKYKNQYIQAPGTLTKCQGSNATNDFIKLWYKKAKRQNVMESVKLTTIRQAELKQLWTQFIESYSAEAIADISSEVGRLLENWEVYKTKIADESFSLDDYTNRLDNNDAEMPGGYLCNFLERTTRTVFGSSKPGNANNFEIKLNSDGQTYTIRKDLKRGDKENNNIKDVTTSIFNETIKPLITDITNTKEAFDKISIIESSKYAAKQVLRKLAVLNHLNDFIFIYSDEVINTLHDEFLDSNEDSNLGKNYEIRTVLNKLLEIDQSPEQAVLLSRFLWLYSNSRGIADINTPNVILYGPPGTGKTYAVKNSLDFVCQGNRNRYEFVQFHPSFTYEDFIEGIKPKGVTKDGNIKFELVDGIFKRFCKKAKQDPDNAYYFVVDEINRANISSVFGETLLCIEKDYRHDVKSKNTNNLIKTQYSALIEQLEEDKKQELAYELIDGQAYFGVPSNLFFIGMMNDVDKSIDAFDLALRRRFKWIRKDCDYDVVEQETKFKQRDEFINIAKYVKACEKLNNYISKDLGLGKSYEFGHSFFMKMDGIAKRKNITKKNMDELFLLHLQPTLKEYLRALYAERELDDKLEIALAKFKEPILK